MSIRKIGLTPSGEACAINLRCIGFFPLYLSSPNEPCHAHTDLLRIAFPGRVMTAGRRPITRKQADA